MKKRYSLQAVAHNLGLILRKNLGVGKPRCLQGGGWLVVCLLRSLAWLQVVLPSTRRLFGAIGQQMQSRQPLTLAA